MQIALSLTLMVLLPAVMMSITPFLRITIVLHFLRQALGTQTTPSNQVLVGLCAVPFAADHAAGGHRYLSQRLGADGSREDSPPERRSMKAPSR